MAIGLLTGTVTYIFLTLELRRILATSHRSFWTKYIVTPQNSVSLLWKSWWRHQMETFSALLAICAGNSPVTGEFPTQRPVTRSLDVFFYLCLNRLWVSNRGTGDLRRYRAHHDVIVMLWSLNGTYNWCPIITITLRDHWGTSNPRQLEVSFNALFITKLSSKLWRESIPRAISCRRQSICRHDVKFDFNSDIGQHKGSGPGIAFRETVLYFLGNLCTVTNVFSL